MLNSTIIHITSMRMWRRFFIAMSSAVVPASRPDRVMLSPYDGRMNGKNIITNIPNPKPLTRCMKLAAIVSMNMSMQVVSIFFQWGRAGYSSIQSSDLPNSLSANSAARPVICLRRSSSSFVIPMLRIIHASDIPDFVSSATMLLISST